MLISEFGRRRCGLRTAVKFQSVTGSLVGTLWLAEAFNASAHGGPTVMWRSSEGVAADMFVSRCHGTGNPWRHPPKVDSQLAPRG